MTQDAVVTKLMPKGMAEVAVSRGTACGGNCGNCESCIYQSEIKTLAKNLIGAKPGQKVIIESQSSKVYGAVFLVYVLPIILMLLAFGISYALGAGEGICVASSFLGLIIGACIMVAVQRRKKEEDQITFDIISLNEGVQ